MPLLPENCPLPSLPPRDPQSHKGTFGTALLIGGSRGMSGAPALSGMAALRSGAGLVRLAIPEACLDTVARFEPCYTTIPLPQDSNGSLSFDALTTILQEAEKATALALGPGLNRSADLDRLVAALYQKIPSPMVVDADALNALSSQKDLLSKPGGPRILTPHPGEFARLVGKKLDGEARQQAAIQLAAQSGTIILLKGHHTLITDGHRTALNQTGNPGMATGGSGDVLTGIITALLCQSLEPFDAAQLGAYLHGLAGDLAAKEKGQTSLIARDLIDFLPRAFRHKRF